MQINDPIYGVHEITDPAAICVIETPEMQRLKGINQYGILNLKDPSLFTSRFEHSVGVYLLLKHLGASREAQLSGLVHDISHTAFSHVVDYIYGDSVEQTVHEKYHHNVLRKSQIPKFIIGIGFDQNYVFNESNHGLLERDAPNLCADRVDYLLRDSVLTGIISPKTSQKIYASLKNFENELVMDNFELAKAFSYISMEACRSLYGNEQQSGMYQLMAEVLKKGFKKGIIDESSLFLEDQEVLDRLKSSGDFEIQNGLDYIANGDFVKGTPEDHNVHLHTKARFVDPNVLIDDHLVRTSHLDSTLASEIDKFKSDYAKGMFIKWSY